MKCFKKILPMIFLTAISSIANANNYVENIYIGDGTSINSDTFVSTTPSTGGVVLSGIYNNCDPAFCSTSSLLRAEISADPLPFVRTSSQTVNFQLDENSFNGSTIAQSTLRYDINVTGTPNSYVPVNMLSLLSSNLNVLAYRGSASVGLLFSNSVNTFGYGLELQGDSVGQINKFQQYQSISLGAAPSTITTINGIEITPQGRIFNVIDNNFTVDETLESQVYFYLNDEGSSVGAIELRSQVSTVAANAFSYVDPFFSIDPTYLALNPNTTLSFTPGVGNLNPLAPVPEPETYAMMLLGLGLIGLATRRKSLQG